MTRIHKLDFEEHNLALDRLMGVGAFSQPSVVTSTLADETATEGEPTESELGGSGRLIAQVTTASGALPIVDAVVTIFRTDGSIIDVQKTDRSGRTSGISLPAPPARYSQQPGGIRPYSTYSLRAESPGYYSKELLNIAVFDQIESIQPVDLEPLGEDALENDRLA